MVHRQVRLVSAVHAEHAEELRVIAGIAAKPHQRCGNGQIEAARDFGQVFRRVIKNDAATEIEHRSFGFFQRFQGAFDLSDVAFDGRLIGAHFDTFRVGKGRECAGNVFRYVNQHRAGATAACDVEGFFDGRREVVHVFDEEAVFDAGAGDANRIHFLKGVVTD